MAISRVTYVDISTYELARIFKDVDVEDGAIWEKRIQYWESLRDAAAMGILQADLSEIVSASSQTRIVS